MRHGRLRHHDADALGNPYRFRWHRAGKSMTTKLGTLGGMTSGDIKADDRDPPTWDLSENESDDEFSHEGIPNVMLDPSMAKALEAIKGQLGRLQTQTNGIISIMHFGWTCGCRKPIGRDSEVFWCAHREGLKILSKQNRSPFGHPHTSRSSVFTTSPTITSSPVEFTLLHQVTPVIHHYNQHSLLIQFFSTIKHDHSKHSQCRMHEMNLPPWRVERALIIECKLEKLTIMRLQMMMSFRANTVRRYSDWSSRRILVEGGRDSTFVMNRMCYHLWTTSDCPLLRGQNQRVFTFTSIN